LDIWGGNIKKLDGWFNIVVIMMMYVYSIDKGWQFTSEMPTMAPRMAQ